MIFHHFSLGKTQENLRNRVNIEAITDEAIALKRVAKPSYKRSLKIREDMVLIQTHVPNVKLNRPIYVGFSVLELSKLHMAQFHYDKMSAWFDDIQLCFTDTGSDFYIFLSRSSIHPPSLNLILTYSCRLIRFVWKYCHFLFSDSLLYEIGGADVYDVMGQHSEEFDLSDYPLDHPLYNTVNKKVIGKFKDELNSIALEEFVGCLPKCYSLLYTGQVAGNRVMDNDRHEKATAKSTKKCVRDRALTHETFRRVILDNAIIKVKQNTIQSKGHKLGTSHQQRIALTPYDTKRYILDDNIMTRAIGHHLNTLDILPNISWDNNDIFEGAIWGDDVDFNVNWDDDVDMI